MVSLAGVNIFEDDPTIHDREVVDFWVCELQMRLNELNGMNADKHEILNLQRALGVTRQQAKFLTTLSGGEIIKREKLIYLHGTKDADDYADDYSGSKLNIISVTISHIRKLLPKDMEIQTVWSVGYVCPPETCAILKAIMNEEPHAHLPIGKTEER